MAEPALRVSREYGDTIDVNLLEMADESRPGTYQRPITEEERGSFGEQVIKLSSTIEDKTEEKKAITQKYSAEIKASKVELRGVLKTLKQGTITEDTNIAVFYDWDNLMVNAYNHLGERQERRRMTPQERQMQIPSNAQQ